MHMLTCYLKLGQQATHIFSDYYSHYLCYVIWPALHVIKSRIKNRPGCLLLYITFVSPCVNCTPKSWSIKLWKIKCVTYMINVVIWHQICLFIRFGSISGILKIILWLATVYSHFDLPDCCSLSRRNEIISEAVACVWFFNIFWQRV
jgi:hypothetical protein